MKQLLLKQLEPLASLEQQEQLIIHGTKDEYILPEELLDCVAHSTALALSKPREETGLTSEELEVIRQFDVVLKWEAKDLDLNAWSNEDLVRRCSEWAEIRAAAGECLAALRGLREGRADDV
jgi:hypothetical protein